MSDADAVIGALRGDVLKVLGWLNDRPWLDRRYIVNGIVRCLREVLDRRTPISVARLGAVVVMVDVRNYETRTITMDLWDARLESVTERRADVQRRTFDWTELEAKAVAELLLLEATA